MPNNTPNTDNRMTINAYMSGIANALGIPSDWDTEYDVFCRLLRGELEIRSGRMHEVLRLIMAKGGYVLNDIPRYLLRYLSDAGLKEGGICDELNSL